MYVLNVQNDCMSSVYKVDFYRSCCSKTFPLTYVNL